MCFDTDVNMDTKTLTYDIYTYRHIFPSPTAAPIHASRNDVRLPQVSRFPMMIYL